MFVDMAYFRQIMNKQAVGLYVTTSVWLDEQMPRENNNNNSSNKKLQNWPESTAKFDPPCKSFALVRRILMDVA